MHVQIFKELSQRLLPKKREFLPKKREYRVDSLAPSKFDPSQNYRLFAPFSRNALFPIDSQVFFNLRFPIKIVNT